MDLVPWMEQWHMLPPSGGIILCAVSGGRDSVCLLHYLCSLREKYGFTVEAAHYNHLMRTTAQRDQDFVTELCQSLHVPLHIDAGDVCAVAREQGLGVEETGRRLRYTYLNKVADAIGADRIATAHHQDDQAETVLLNLLRGTGAEGLRGIPPVRGRLIRPLLDTPREEIEAYLAEHGLSHVEDETNESLRFGRNRLRKNVVPELEKIHPAFRQNIARTAAIVGREDRYLNELAASRLPKDGTEVPCDALRRAPEVLRPRMVRLLLARLPVGKKDMTAAHIAAVTELALSGRSGMVDLPGATALCRNGCLQFVIVAPRLPKNMVLTEGENHWGPWRVQVICRTQWTEPEDAHTILLGRDKIGHTVEIAPCDVGERLKLKGSRGSRSVKRLLKERGIAPDEIRQLAVIRTDGCLAAVAGLGTDEKFLPPEGGEAVEITLQYKRS